MATRKDNGPTLFDILEIETAKAEGAECPHKREKRSETYWRKETFTRLTMTCLDCGRIRGRYPGE